MDVKKTTIHDIASKLNMSASTVSRALNDYYRISQKTRDLVKETATEMNYKPNHLASNLRTGKGKMLGVIVPRINRHFFSHAIAGMEKVTNPAGYNLIICQTNEDYEIERQSLQTLLNNRIDGLLISISSATKNEDHIISAINENVPIVFFDRILNSLEVDHVINDNFSGGYEVTKHLIEQGYRNIFHFSGPLHINIYNYRYQGYKQAMFEAGIEVTPEMVFEDVLTRAKGEVLAEKLIASKKIPDAIFSASDFSALSALLVFKKYGIKIPLEMGIAGFANEPFTELTEPSMTTLEQFSEEIGKSSARMLIDRIEQGVGKESSKSMTFKPRLIIRDSSNRNKKNIN